MNTLLRVTGVAKLDGPSVTRWTGVVLILLVGIVHLVETPEHFEIAPYLGALFAANFTGSVVAAAGIYRGWLLGALISGAS